MLLKVDIVLFIWLVSSKANGYPIYKQLVLYLAIFSGIKYSLESMLSTTI